MDVDPSAEHPPSSGEAGQGRACSVSDGATTPPGVRPTGSGDRLLLDLMLRELGARDGADVAVSRSETLTVGELVDKAAQSGFGFLIAVLSLIAIPFVGLSTPFGLAIALCGAQLAIGRARPWLPARARRRSLPMSMFDRVLGILARRTRWLARSTRPRWSLMVRPRLVGLGVVLLSLGLALPLPIPGSNMIFIVPLLIYAVGLLERDGVWIMIAHVATVIDVVLVAVFGATVLAVLARMWHWIV